MDSITSTTLLEGLRRPQDQAAWSRFNRRYRPLVVGFARRLGLDETDALDAAQEAMLAFIQAYREGQYERERGRLKNWLLGIAKRKVAAVVRQRGRELVLSGKSETGGLLENFEPDDRLAQLWETQWQNAVLRACLDAVAGQVDAQTYRAFELYVLEDWPVQRVAEHLDVNANTVYIAKSRILDRIRELWPKMAEEW